MLVIELQRQQLDTTEVVVLAVIRLLEIVGEAAKNISQETRQASSAIPWAQIAGTRDRLIHGYFDVDLDILWSIVQQDIPVLIAELTEITGRLDYRHRARLTPALSCITLLQK